MLLFAEDSQKTIASLLRGLHRESHEAADGVEACLRALAARSERLDFLGDLGDVLLAHIVVRGVSGEEDDFIGPADSKRPKD